jgi:hypothetical protein
MPHKAFDHRIEGKLLGAVGFLASFAPPIDFEGAMVDPNRGSEAVEEEGAHMLLADSILA